MHFLNGKICPNNFVFLKIAFKQVLLGTVLASVSENYKNVKRGPQSKIKARKYKNSILVINVSNFF